MQVQFSREALQAKLLALHRSMSALCGLTGANSAERSEHASAQPGQARPAACAHPVNYPVNSMPWPGLDSPAGAGRALLACAGSVCMPVIATALASPGS
jgi:hypothetical protein